MALFGAIADVGVDGAGADGVDTDVVARQFQGGHFHEGDLAGFAGAVRGRAGGAEGAGAIDAAGDDDAAAAGFAEMGEAIVGGEVGAFEVNVESLVPLVGLEFLDGRRDAVDARVGDNDMQSAEANGGGDGFFYLVRLGNIAGEIAGVISETLDLFDDILGRPVLLGGVEQGDLAPGVRRRRQWPCRCRWRRR